MDVRAVTPGQANARVHGDLHRPHSGTETGLCMEDAIFQHFASCKIRYRADRLVNTINLLKGYDYRARLPVDVCES